MQAFVDTLYPDGIDLRIIARSGPELTAIAHRFALRFDKSFADAPTRREQLRAWGRKGGQQHDAKWMAKIGRRGARSRNKKLTKEKRSELARRAALARRSRTKPTENSR